MLLVLGAGYLGAAAAALALDRGMDVVLADNWRATDREQLSGLEARGAAVETADVRDRAALDRLLAAAPERVLLLAAQASRPLSEREPDYTEETNLTGARRVAEAVAASEATALVYGSSLHVYGPDLHGEVDADRPYGPQGDLSHLSKVYGELVLGMHARRGGFGCALLRLGIVYGPSPVEHAGADSQTVVDRFRRLVAAGEPLRVDAPATIGVAHVGDVARVLLDAPVPAPGEVTAANVAAETVTVPDVAALARGEAPAGEPAWTVASPFAYAHDVAGYLRP